MNFSDFKCCLSLPNIYLIFFLFFFSSTARATDIQAQRKILNEAQKEAYARWKAEQKGINANVYGAWGQGKTKSGPLWQAAEWQWRQTLFDSFFGFFVNNNAVDDQCGSGYCKDNSKNQREFFKEIAGEPDGQNSFTEIRSNFSDKLPSFVPQNNHGLNVAHEPVVVKISFYRQHGRVENTGLDGLSCDRREFTQDVFNIHTCGQSFQNNMDRGPGSYDAGFSVLNAGIDSDVLTNVNHTKSISRDKKLSKFIDTVIISGNTILNRTHWGLY